MRSHPGEVVPCLVALMRSHSLVADFGAIVRRRKPDNPVKDGALSQPFLLVSLALRDSSLCIANGLFASAKRRPFAASAANREALAENVERSAERL